MRKRQTFVKKKGKGRNEGQPQERGEKRAAVT
jgi:hypothetical protein